jgi:hypothetical protein
MKYPLYTYQKRKQYEIRLTSIFPVDHILSEVDKIPEEEIKKYKTIEIHVEVSKLEKLPRNARKYIKLYEEYVEEALPIQYKTDLRLEPRYFEYSVETLIPRWQPKEFYYEPIIRVGPKYRKVKKDKRKLIEYSQEYILKLNLFTHHKENLMNILSSFLYPQPLHRLDLFKLAIYGIDLINQKHFIFPSQLYTKVPFRMPVWENKKYGFIEQDVLKILEKIFSFPYFLEQTWDQLYKRYVLAFCLTPLGEPIARRYVHKNHKKEEIKFETPLQIKEFFENEKGIEYYRSNDKIGIDKVDMIILEFDTPLRDLNPKRTWERIITDEEKFLKIVKDYGIKLESIEENFSGNKSLQRLIHIYPSISYEEARDIYYFFAVFHKFVVAKDSYFYTLDRTSGLSRVTKTLADYSYGRKKEIKVVPTINMKREAIHCSVPLKLDLDSGKFEDSVLNYDYVRKKLCFYENVLKILYEDSLLSDEEKIFKPQNYFEKNATHPKNIKKVMEEYVWLVDAMKKIEPGELDLWKMEWLKEKFY